MTLLNAPAYNEKRARTLRNVLIGSIVAVFVLLALTLTGFIMGHGWLFTNLPAEHRVNSFFDALEGKDYSRAYAIYTNNVPANQKDYPLDKFTDDWTRDSPVDGPILSHHVDISKTDGSGTFGSGIIVAVRASSASTKNKKLFMYYIRKDGSLTWPAYHQLQYDAH